MSVPFDDCFALIHELTREGRFAEAIFLLLDARTGRINNHFAGDMNHAWYCVADSMFRLGDIRGSITAFKKALAFNPDDVECLLAIANCYDALRRPKLAERYLRKALVLKPKGRNKAAVLLNLGNALMDQLRWSDAIDCLNPLSKRKDDIGIAARKNRVLALGIMKKAIRNQGSL
jgi:tetratricopeptide (TPR) repeat protein